MRIGAPDGCANYLLPQVCAAICDAHPGLEVQIVALPRVFNLSRREADMAIAVSPPAAGRLTVQKLTDYHLHLAGTRDYLARHPPITTRADLKGHRMIGYIPDMIFDKELDYLAETGAQGVSLASNSVSVQMQMIRAGAGLGIVHDFAIPACPGVVRVLAHDIALTRAFWLIRHADDRRSDRLNRLAEALATGLRREVARLEAFA
jgi:DNA-binding transcriptional LysR family regulator